MRASRRLASWLPRVVGTADLPSDLTREARARSAVLSPAGVIGVCSVLALMAVGLATASAWVSERRALATSAAAAAARTDAALQEVAHEIDVVEAVAARAGMCDATMRQALARAAIGSMLAREFFVEADGDAAPCGAFGVAERAWTADPSPTGTLQVVPAEDIRGGVVVRRPFATHAVVAYVEPRQFLDRMPETLMGHVITLRSGTGWLLGQSGAIASSPLLQVRHPVGTRGLFIEMPLTWERLVACIADRATLWLAVWLLACVVAVSGANRAIARRASRHRQLTTALRKRRFVPVVQPIVDATTGACLGAEVLMRWKHPSRGLVPPLEFIDYAERSGLIVPMSDLLMRTARDQLAELAAARPSLVFSFNATPAQLRLPDFAASLLDVFDGAPIGPSRVVIELTERDLVDAQVRDQLTRLRALGFRIAIDDFGTGQSSLALLQDLPVDRLKIDREFVRTVEPGVGDPPVLDAIIDLAHRLELGMIAEGVETPMQQAWLRARGVQALQGYLTGRPMTVIDFRTWLAQHDPAPDQPLPDAAVDLAEVADAIRAAPGLRRDRWHHLRRYPDCLVGADLVAWWSRTRGLSRDDAVRLGRRLVAKGWLLHVHEEHDFEDGPYFYQLVSRQTQQDTAVPLPSDLPPTGQTLAWLLGEAGVRPGPRVRGLIQHRNAVSGHEVVEALRRAGSLSRERAILCGHALLRAGRLRHVSDESGFSEAGTAHFYFA